MSILSEKCQTAVLISGRGSNMQSLVRAARAADYPAEISLVISNRPDAAGLEFAMSEGIATEVIDHRAYDNREDFDLAIHHVLRQRNIEYVACAGFMRILSEKFVRRWQGRMINIHPSLLPAYKGLNTHERVLADGAKVHGCTVHFVTAELDDGPIIGQREVEVLASDTAETLAARVLEQEHALYPEALAMVAGGDVVFEAESA